MQIERDSIYSASSAFAYIRYYFVVGKEAILRRAAPIGTKVISSTVSAFFASS